MDPWERISQAWWALADECDAAAVRLGRFKHPGRLRQVCVFLADAEMDSLVGPGVADLSLQLLEQMAGGHDGSVTQEQADTYVAAAQGLTATVKAL